MSGDPYIKENEQYSLEIERLVLHKHKLEAEIARLRAALEEMSAYPVAGDAMVMLDIARKALAKEGK